MTEPTTEAAESSREVAIRTTPQLREIAAIPSQAELSAMWRLVDVISRSDIVPRSYRTEVAPSGHIFKDRRPNAMVAAMMGRTFGWDLLTAMRNIHVIEGSASLRPEATLGMIRAHGHRVSIRRSADHVDVYARRVDTGDEMNASFSFHDAVRAGLCTLDDKGQPRALSDNGRPLPWQQYPVDMCQWRAVAVVGRGLFSDITLGLSYLPEELGAIVDAEGEVVIESGPMPSSSQEAAPGAQETAQPRQAQQTIPHAQEAPAPTLEADLAGYEHALKAQEASRANLPSERAAMSRAWMAIKALHPKFDDQALTAELDETLAAIGAERASADTDTWHAVAEHIEAQVREMIKARYPEETSAEEEESGAES